MKTNSVSEVLKRSDRVALEQWHQALKAAQAKNAITIEAISERAIDIVLAVLINTDPEFRQWMASQILGDSPADFLHCQALWGVCYAGEADMVWFLVTDGRRMALMFENKINCGPQESQHERYLQRGEHWKRIGLVDDSKVILLSPASYRSTEAHKYDVRLTYEEIVTGLNQASSGMPLELARLLALGLNKPQGVWGSVGTDSELLDWISWLYDLQAQHFPSLWIIGKCSTGKGGKVSPWIERSFTKEGHGFTLRLKFGMKPNGSGWGTGRHFSAVDLHINGAASRSSLLLPELRNLTADSPLRSRETGKSLAIGRDVPLVTEKVYDAQRAIESLRAAEEIQNWFETNQQSLIDLLNKH